MGYCYQVSGGTRLLCCDVCGHAGGCRKVACKYGYCQAKAMCERHRKDPATKAAQREHCETHCKPAAAEFAAEQAAVAAVLATGAHAFCAALNDGDAVKVWFRNAGGESKELRVTSAVYETLTRTSTYDDALMARFDEGLEAATACAARHGKERAVAT